MIANNAAASLLFPFGARDENTLGGGIWRTPHLGQISALARMTLPHSLQYFSSGPFWTDSDMGTSRETTVFTGPENIESLPETFRFVKNDLGAHRFFLAQSVMHTIPCLIA
jgi:hypothetical protein